MKEFVVFEGLDGSGTSTQAALLEKAWQRKGKRVLLTSEPSPGPIGNLIREAFKGRTKFQSDKTLFDHQMAYLFAADRFDHLYNDVDGIVPMIEGGFHVISTRYYFSSFAYHCSNEYDWALVRRLNESFPPPGLLVYLRNSVAESVRRLGSRAVLDRYEEKEKLALVASNYERILKDFTGRKIILDATLPAEAIHSKVLSTLEDD